jgi:hypothetical protein
MKASDVKVTDVITVKPTSNVRDVAVPLVLKPNLVNSVGSFACAVLAFSFGLVGSQVYAEGHDAISSPVQTMYLDTDAPVAEWWICSSDGQVCINTHQSDLQLATSGDHSLAPRVRNLAGPATSFVKPLGPVR